MNQNQKINNSTPNDYNVVLGERKTISLDDLEGWNPIQVIYELSRIHNVIKMEWFVDGTEKKFHIPLHFIYENEGSIEKHLKKFLRIFREDYLEWQSQDFKEDWMKNYQSQFNSLILVDI